MAKNSVAFCVRKDLNASALTVNYQAINPDGFDIPVMAMRLVNNSNKDLDISFDGSADHYMIQDGEVLELDFQTNANPTSFYCNAKLGQQVFVKAAAAGTGYIYLSAFGQGL